MDIAELERKKLSELKIMGRELSVAGFSTMKKQQLMYEIMRTKAAAEGIEFRGGILEVIQEEKQPIGFLRSGKDYSAGPVDIYVSNSQIRRWACAMGIW